MKKYATEGVFFGEYFASMVEFLWKRTFLLGAVILLILVASSMAQVPATPQFEPGSSSYSVAFPVKITCVTPGASIYYTADGRDPAPPEIGFNVASGFSLQARHGLTLKAVAQANGLLSPVAQAHYEVTGAISGGGTHAILLDNDGVLWSWGQQENGRLANGENADASMVMPQQVLRKSEGFNVPFTDAVDGSAGATHSLFLNSTGEVYSCGSNSRGELGNNSTVDSTTAIRVLKSASGVDFLSGIVQVAAGHEFSVAVGWPDGEVWAWGAGDRGRLGNGVATGVYPYATRVTTHANGYPFLRGIEGIAAGDEFVLAKDRDGRLWGWGANESGQLGIGTLEDHARAVQVMANGTDGAFDGVIGIAAGKAHAVAIREMAGEDKTVWCWGAQRRGALGNGQTEMSAVVYPVRVLKAAGERLDGIVQVRAGPGFTLALDRDGKVWGWGDNRYGQLGNGTTTDSAFAQLVSFPEGTVISAIGAGGNESVGTGFGLAVAVDGTVYSWGSHVSGENSLNGEAEGDASLVTIAKGGAPIGKPSGRTMAMFVGGNEGGEFQFGVQALTGESPLSNGGIAGGGYHVIALKTDGNVSTWGAQDNGRLGNDATAVAAITVPQVFKKLTGSAIFADAVSVAAGAAQSYAIDSGGYLYSAGSNSAGELGNNSVTDSAIPVRVLKSTTATDYLSDVKQVDGGLAFGIALTGTGEVWVWGSGNRGSLGDGMTSGTSKFAKKVTTNASGNPALSGVQKIAAGSDFGLALGTNGRLWSWGSNTAGQLGIGGTTDQGRAINVLTNSTGTLLRDVVDIAAGHKHAVAIKSDRTVWCWGEGQDGRLGNGLVATGSSPYPGQVLRSRLPFIPLADIIQVAAGPRHTIALDITGKVWTWGDNTYGQLGDGTTWDRDCAVLVSFPEGVVIKAVAAGGYEKNGSHTGSFSIAVSMDGTIYAWGSNSRGELGISGDTTQKTTPQVAAPGIKLWPPTMVTLDISPSGSNFIAPISLSLSATLSNFDGPSAPVVSFKSGATVLGTASSVPYPFSWNNVASGTYSITASAPTGLGTTITSAAQVIQIVRPTVSIAALVPNAYGVTNEGPANGVFRLTRNFSGTTPGAALVVGFSVSGSAVAGQSYDAIASTATIPAGQSYVDLAIAPIASFRSDDDKTVVITLNGSSSSFSADPVNNKATVTLIANPYVKPPQFTPKAVTKAVAFPVKITCPTPGATIYYTVNGAIPNPPATGTLISSGSSILVRYSLTLKAIAIDGAGHRSLITVADYAITGAIKGGGSHAVALTSDQKLWSWGQQGGGRLGNGQMGTATMKTPQRVLKVTGSSSQVFTDAVDISAGYAHSVFLDSQGEVYACGINTAGELGNNTAVDSGVANRVLKSASPTDYLGGILQVSAGKSFSAALSDDGEVWTWGDGNRYAGKVLTQTSSPKVALGGIEQIATGDSFTIARDNQGKVWSWGSNTYGTLGNGTVLPPSPLSPVVQVQLSGTGGALTDVIEIAAGGAHAVAIRQSATENGTVWCWGQQEFGRLGNGSTDIGSVTYPVKVQNGSSSFLTNVIKVAAGPSFTLALDRSGRVWSWGNNQFWQLGNNPTNRTVAGIVSFPLGTVIVAIGVGGYDSIGAPVSSAGYAIDKYGKIYSWGSNASGELGRDTNMLAIPQLITNWLTPAINLTISPAENEGAYIAPIDLTLTASLSDFEGASTGVDFLSGSTSLSSVLEPPYTYAWNHVLSGTYSLTAKAKDGTGVTSPAKSITIVRPTVSVVASVPNAYENNGSGPANGIFRFNRNFSSETPGGAIEVFFTVTGSATAGSDYAALPASITIPTGAAYVDLAVAPFPDTFEEGDETVIVTLDGRDNYTIGASSQATVKIIDDPAAAIATPRFALGIPVSPVAVPIKITCATPGVSIYYTLDGTNPNPPATGALIASGDEVLLSHNLTLKALAVDGNNRRSLIAETEYSVIYPVGTDSDGNGLPDWWQWTYFGHLGVDPNGDADGDGVSNLQEYQNGTVPTDFYNGRVPTVAKFSGDGQTTPANNFLPEPLKVLVSGSGNLPLINAPVVFTVSQGGGTFSLTGTGSPLGNTLSVRTDSNGHAAVFFKQPIYGSTQNTISVSAGQSAPAVFTATTADLVGHWKFEETTGTLSLDSSGVGNHANQYGTISETGFEGAHSIGFDNSGLVIPNAQQQVIPADGKPFSIAFWFKQNTVVSGQTQSLMCNETYLTGGFRMALDCGGYFTGANRLMFWSHESGGSMFTMVGNIVPGLWYHAVVTYNGNSVSKVYLNGELVGTAGGLIKASERPELIVGTGIGGKIGFKGMIDDLRIYSSVIDASTVRGLYSVDNDANGLPDWWEQKYFGSLGNNPNAYPDDGMGLTNAQEAFLGINPRSYDAGSPVLTIVGGQDLFSIPGGRTMDGQVRVTGSSGVPLAAAPVRFSVTSGQGLLYPANGSLASGTNELIVVTDNYGYVRSGFSVSPVVGEASVVTVSAKESTALFQLKNSLIVGRWDMDEEEGSWTLYDRGGMENHVWLNDFLESTTGYDSAPAFALNGAWQYGWGSGAPSQEFGDGAISFMGWFKLADDISLQTSSDRYSVVEKGYDGRGFGVALRGGAYHGIYGWFGDDTQTKEMIPSLDQASLINDHQWHHFALVRDAQGSASLYLDGKVVGSRLGVGLNVNGSSSLKFGLDEASWTSFKGAFQKFKLFAKEVTQDEIWEQYDIDRDGNGIPDGWELKYFGMIGIDPDGDADGDGISNLVEWQTGRNPLIPEPPPIVDLIDPRSGMSISKGDNILLSATASAAAASGTITKVEFFDGNAKVGEASREPYTSFWRVVTSGTHVFTARATDGLGLVGVSSPRTITIKDVPSIQITSPASNAVVTSGSNLVVTATASSETGTITSVELYQNSQSLGLLTAPPYAVQVNDLEEGSHTFYAKSIDGNGAQSVSLPVKVIAAPLPTVVITSPGTGSSVPAGRDLSITAEILLSQGVELSRVEFYDGDDKLGERTHAPYLHQIEDLSAGEHVLTARVIEENGRSVTSAPITVTAKRGLSVTLTGPSDGTVLLQGGNLTLVAAVTDPDEIIDRVIFSNGTALGTVTTEPYTLSLNNLPSGDHRIYAIAKDIWGGESVSASIEVRVDQAPVVRIKSPEDNAVVSAGAPLEIETESTLAVGAVQKVEIFSDETLLGEAKLGKFIWKVLESGTHRLTAKATTEHGSVAISDAVSITAVAPPVVSLVSSTNATVVPPGSSFTLTANATSGSGVVTLVELFDGASKVGEFSSGPYVFTINSLAAGQHTYFARVTDSFGIKAQSSVIRILASAESSVAPGGVDHGGSSGEASSPQPGGGGLAPKTDPDPSLADASYSPPTLSIEMLWDASKNRYDQTAVLVSLSHRFPNMEQVVFEERVNGVAWVECATQNSWNLNFTIGQLLADNQYEFRAYGKKGGNKTNFTNVVSHSPQFSLDFTSKHAYVSETNPGFKEFEPSSPPKYYLTLATIVNDNSSADADWHKYQYSAYFDLKNKLSPRRYFKHDGSRWRDLKGNGFTDEKFSLYGNGDLKEEMYVNYERDSEGAWSAESFYEGREGVYFVFYEEVEDPLWQFMVEFDEVGPVTRSGKRTVTDELESMTSTTDTTETLSDEYTSDAFVVDVLETKHDYGNWDEPWGLTGLGGLFPTTPTYGRVLGFTYLNDNGDFLSFVKGKYRFKDVIPSRYGRTYYEIFVPKGESEDVQVIKSVNIPPGARETGTSELDIKSGKSPRSDEEQPIASGIYCLIEGAQLTASGPGGRPLQKNSGGDATIGGGLRPGESATFHVGTAPIPGSVYTVTFSGTGFIVLDFKGNPVSGSYTFTYEQLTNGEKGNSFTLIALSGSSGSAHVTLTSGLAGSSIGSDTINVVMQDKDPDDPVDVGVDTRNYTAPADYASGTRYRKIALNGRPMPDEKPQHSAETDEEKEETYVDAMTTTLRHSTTDVYIPIPGSPLTLSARRNIASETWTMRNGLRPHERPDRPFGVGWTSNLTPNVDIVVTPDRPSYAYVTDENGASHRFIRAAGTWIPMPTSNVESIDYLAKFDGTTFSNKFGNRVIFEPTTIVQSISADRVGGSHSNETHTYLRTKQVIDRMGVVVNYSYISNSTVIPMLISLAGHPDQTIYIAHDNNGLITSIWDPNGNRTQFFYQKKPVIHEWTLTEVKGADNGVTRYGYDFSEEPDQTLLIRGESAVPKQHCDVTSIQDPMGNVYSFTYDFDHTKQAYSAVHGAYYTQTGLPRLVTRVDLPGNIGYASFQNHSSIAVTYGSDLLNMVPSLTSTSICRSQVTDAEGKTTTYLFDQGEVHTVNSDTVSAETSGGKIVYFKKMTIAHPTGGSEVYTFDPSAGMALKSSTDISGNTTNFDYINAWSVPSSYYSVFPIAGFNTFYNDPTSQTNAQGHTKTFTYGTEWRIMSSSTDEESRKTEYALDSLGRRTSEIVKASSGATVQQTNFTYGNSSFPGVVTQKTVKTLSGDPSWARDLVTSYSLDQSGRVASETVNPGGLTLTTYYTYDSNGNKLSSTDPNSHTTYFEYDRKNRLAWVTYADGSDKNLSYDLRGNKIEETDENGNVTTFQYDALNRLTRTAKSDGAGQIIAVQYGYNRVGSKTSVIDAKGVSSTMEYDAIQRLTKTTTPAGDTTLLYGANSGGSAFDSSAFKPTSSTDPRGYTTTVIYDSLYRPTNRSIAYGSEQYANSTLAYDKVGNLISETDPLSKTTTTNYDTLNRPINVTLADGSIVRTYYTASGLKWKASDELSRNTEIEYDAAARPIKTLSPILSGTTRATTQSVFDGAGNIVAVINPLGKQTDFTFDSRNRKKTETGPEVFDAQSGNSLRPVTLWDYDNVGKVIGVTDPNGYTTNTEYDDANRPVRAKAPAVVDPSDSASKRPTVITTYDANGNVLSVTDANGHTTTNVYDTLNRLTSTTDAAGITVSYEYDAEGNRTKVTDGNLHSTLFEYDGLNRNTRITNVANQSTSFAYNALNKTSRTDANGQTTSYTYDNRHRLITVSYSIDSSGNRTHSYDPVGNLLSVVELGKGGKADVAYTYDALNRVITEISGGITHQYEYDLAGNRLKTTYGGSGLVIDSTYDALNRLSTMVENGRTTTYRYDLNGKVLEKELPGGTLTETTYDAMGRILSIQESVGNSDLSLTLQKYDLGGNVKAVEERYFSGSLTNRTVRNSYDSANRLNEEVVDLGSNGVVDITTNYVYDAGNNRTEKTVVGGTNAGVTTYTINNLDQVVALSSTSGSTSFTYDTNGNRKVRTKGVQTDTYTYDGENRLTELVKTIPDAGLTTGTFGYTYDYRTRRVERDESGAGGNTTKIVFSGGLSCFETESGARTVEYIRGSDYGGGVGGILYTLRGSAPSFNHYNNRGDVVAKTDGAGILTYQAQYEAFGKRLREEGTTSDRQKMNTKEEDPTGLVNHGFRYFDLETEGWLTRDPAGFVDGPNLYAYVRQNPWTKFDPEGLASGFFFDGTGDDKNDKTRSKTHIAALYDTYRGEKFYINGVGTRTDVALGLAFGKGASARIDMMMSALEKQLATGEKTIDVFGFSRGAAMAREFANRIHDAHPELKIRFMGLFDTVAQIGRPNGHSGVRLNLPDNVSFAAHAIAKNEYRTLFPLTPISNIPGGMYGSDDYKTSTGIRFIEKPFAGAHADVGGGYADGGNRLALKWMMQQGREHGVRFSWSQLSSEDKHHFNQQIVQPHNSRQTFATGAPLWGLTLPKRQVIQNSQ